MSLTTTIEGGLVQLTGNPIWIKLSGAIIPAGASQYKCMLRIISQDSKLYGAPFTDAIPPDSNGEALFDISGLVDQPIKKLFQFPLSGASVSYPTEAFNIEVQNGERYVDADGTLHEIWGDISDTFQLLKGGASPRQIALWNDAGSDFYSTYLGAGRFLTHRPWGDFVHPDQPVKLSYMSVINQDVDFTVIAYFQDGTKETYSVPVILNTDSLYEFNCNPKHLGITIETATTKVNHFDVSLKIAGESVSDKRRFHYDWIYCQRPFFLLFANSIGGIDDIYLGGYASEKFKLESAVLQRPQQKGDSVFDATLIPSNKTGQNNWTLNTGAKDSTQMLHLRDLLLSDQIWLLYPNLSVTIYMIVPVNILEFDEVLIDRIKNIYSANLKVSEAHTSRFSFDNRIQS
jgi:hypothetical protein